MWEILVHIQYLSSQQNQIVRYRGLSQNCPVRGSYSCLLIGECPEWQRDYWDFNSSECFGFQLTKSNVQEATFYSFFWQKALLTLYRIKIKKKT